MTTPSGLPLAVEVAAPSVERYPFGLLSAASVVPTVDDRWEAYGVVYQTDACAQTGALWYPECPPGGAAAFRVGFTRPADSNELTFTLLATGDCTSPSVTVSVDQAAGTTLDTINESGTATIGAPGSTVRIDLTTSGDGDASCDCYTTQTFTIPAAATEWSFEMTCPSTVAANAEKEFGVLGDVVEGVPFQVYDGVRCPAVSVEEARDRAERRFVRREQYMVENHFYTFNLRGAQLQFGGTAMPLLRGVGLLEDYLAEQYGGIGVIHAPREFGALMTKEGLTRRDGARLRTPLDNLWAFGAGYGNAHPTTGAEAPAGQGWLYATGPVVVRRGDLEIRDAFDQRKNTRLAVAERSYVITAECPLVAVLVSHPEV